MIRLAGFVTMVTFEPFTVVRLVAREAVSTYNPKDNKPGKVV